MNAVVENIRNQKRIRRTNRLIISAALLLMALYFAVYMIAGVSLFDAAQSLGQRQFDWFADAWLY